MNPEKEKLLKQTYEKFMLISMNKLPGDLLDGITDEDIMAYGTTIDEKLLSVKDCKDLVERQLKQGRGMKFKHERIPEAVRISPEEDSAIFVEELNLTISSSQVAHKLFLRITTVLEYCDEKWKVVHFHTSKPDDSKSKTDTWHIDEWKRKNEELQKLVNEKTLDLVKKNKDLEIETSLERVRTVSMSMKMQNDLLDICEALFKELHSLGFNEMRNAMINIFNDDDETFVNYDFSDTLGKSITPLFYDIHPIIKKQVKQVRKSKDAYTETVFTIKDLTDWKKFRKSRGEQDDPRLKKAKALHYYFYSVGTAAIGISTFSPITVEKKKIIKRFRNVFDFAYRRYMDVTQAEAQAREAKIEIALERVRSRTMAMQKSEELSETTFLLFQQFMDLGEAPDQITIGIINKEEKVIEFWTTMEGNKVDQMVKFPIKETNLMLKLHAAWKNQKKSLAIEIKGKELHDYIDYRIRLTGVKTKTDHTHDHRYIQAAFFSKGMITISTNDPRSQETIQLLERFAGVFELTYTRFLDLKLSEKQTREAKIELSLERVRARSMAMHRSDELVDASIVLFNELKSLGIEAIRTGVAIVDSSNDTLEIWSSQLIEEKRNKILGVVPFKSHPFFEGYYKAWKRKQKYFLYEVAGKDVKKYYKAMSSLLSYSLKKEFNSKEFFYTFFFPEGSLNVVSHKNLSGDECSLMLRFSKVFGMIYRRFLDLQKAEAQAREAQIEVALERVRSRTMAMHKSEELQEAAVLLFQQIRDLGVNTGSCGYIIWDKGKKDATAWMSSAEGGIQEPFKLSHTKSKIYIEIYTANNSGKDFFVKGVKGKELRNHFDYLSTVPGIGEKIKQLRKARYKFPDTIVYNIAFFKQGYLSFHTHEISPEAQDIFRRFANVFEQTYTRFLDLQKAESLAREAQIEAALERVRSRTMAMHSSEDVGETVVTMFDELTKLGIKPYRCGIGTFNDKKQLEAWAARTDSKGKTVIVIGKLDMTKHPLLQGAYDGWKKGRSYFDYELTGKDVLKYFKVINKLPDYPVKYDIRKLPKRILHHDFYFPEGTLFAFTLEPLSNEVKNIFNRFASVFGQTYRRYLDLKKAEGQAREARIQLALERVRAKAMAMQKSDELLGVSLELYNQFKQLDSTVRGLTINIINERERVFDVSFGMFNQSFKLSIDEQIVMSKAYKSWKSGKKSLVLKLSQKELLKFNKIRNKAVGSEIFPLEYKSGFKLIMYMAFFSNGMLIVGMEEDKPEETIDILQRFASVFDMTYTRFLDLQKAEAQAREAQIEAALERVRSRSMGMQKSEELKDVIQIVYEQFVHLKVNTEHAGFIMDYKTRDDFDNWIADPRRIPFQIIIPYFDTLIYNRFNEAKEKGEDFFTLNLNFKEKNNFYKKLFKFVPGLTEEVKKFYFNCPGLAFSTVLLDNVALYIENFSGTPFTDEENSILMRFGNVFQQTYTRFLDLQKAEVQAREAKIEAALERTRTQSMIMQHSKELDDTLRVFHEQVLLLGIQSEFSFLWLPDEEKDRHIFWVTWLENGNDTTVFKSKAINYPLDRNEPATAQCMVDWKSDEPVHSYTIPPAGVKNYFAAWSELFAGAEQLQPKYFKKGLYYVEAFMKYGCFGVMIKNELSADEKKILLRFAIEFERTYTRFLDLQKAEAQAREAQIEAALEKVRGKAMAMHNSSDLTIAAGMVFTELSKLGIKPIRSGFVLLSNNSPIAKLYPATSFDNENTVSFTGEFEFTGHPVYEKQYEIWQKKENYFPVLEGDLLKTYYKILAKGLSVPYENFPTDKKQFGTFLPFSEGFLFAWSKEPYSENEINILDRFKNILDLTIRRYIDLKNAETQSRESQIEASLERVRSKAMAMQKSDDLSIAVAAIFEELDRLNLEILRCGIGIINKENRSVEVWATTVADNEKIVQISGDESMDIHPLLQGAFNAWLKQEDFSYLLQGEDLVNYYRSQMQSNFKLPDSQSILSEDETYKQYYFVATFQSGGLFAFRESEFPEETKSVIRRFADVINFTYTRFNDLKLAEAQAREAQIEAALERVRSRTLAMQKSDELAETAAVVFKQLINLGIEPNRLYIGIVNDDSGNIEAWATDEDGSKVSREFTLNINANASVKKMHDGWAEKKSSIIIDMQGKELEEYLHYIGDELHVPFKGGLSQYRRMQNIAYFSKGFIGMASPDPQPEETGILLERFAAVFNLTFTRFNDLKIAEKHAEQAELDLIKLQTEKKRAEEALTELRSTQAQLIQSEKMASLGELTAGIAHEIQNPLNFVNNFSEVNAELIDELNEEIGKGNFEEAALIAKDIKDNEEKIKHHGKRAEGIVKGMLQHSRSSSGVKEPVNINALADEYLRLAYHGLRAKDKTFNAKMETDFDESIGEINVVPQEIGRVILNLITNAFYVVTEKKKEEPKDYEPTVKVSTKKSDDKVQISVKDNGSGIPQKVMDKIFQPFFTTKPTGQGTGLGLSMSYDIIKAHGGELKVETKEGEGSEFVILLNG